MKIYISIDMEGMPGTYNWEQEKTDRPAVRRSMARHVSDALEAILKHPQASDIEVITIADSHAGGDNLDYSITELDSRISLISGGPRPAYMMPAFSSDYSLVMLLGYHAGTGALRGNMDHTYSNSRIQKIWINDLRMNEALINAAYAGYHGVPVGVVSGDLTLQQELQTPMPWLHYVCTKEAVAKFAARNYSAALVKQSLYIAIDNCLNNISLPLYSLESPLTLKIEFHSTAMADVACLMPYVIRLDGRTVEYVNNDYGIVFEAIMALVTLASTATL